MTERPTLTREIIESDSQPVDVMNGHVITRGMMSKAFDMVADKTNWKNPIDATVRADAYGRELIRRAITFYTGSTSKFELVGVQQTEPTPSLYRCIAKGYYLATGS